MRYQQIQIEDTNWHYQIGGTGDHLLIALHGFGEDSSLFADWEISLGSVFTILAIDLPFHGAAKDWERPYFRPSDFVPLFQALHKKYNKPYCSLLGQSFGASVIYGSWKLLDFLPSAVWLLNPGGLATRRLGIPKAVPGWLRGLIGGSIDKRTTLWMKFAQQLHRLDFLDTFSLSYLRYHFAKKERLRRLIGVWRSLKYFPIKKQPLLKEAKQGTVPIQLVIGKTDELINWNQLHNWLDKWPSELLHLLDLGHQLVNEVTAKLLMKKLG